jgi:hypothetical protein
MNPTDIKGYGIDADPTKRPGIPMEHPLTLESHPPRPPPRQESAPAVPIPGRADRKMPPVFGTAEPPKGLSGALRLFAYKYPSHRKRHWLLLLVADRVDVLEHRLRSPVALAAALLVGGMTMRLLKR